MIHKNYEEMVEGQIKAQLGDEKMKKVELGLAKYVEETEKGTQTQEVYEALELLTSLADFSIFKKIMLAKKSELSGATGGLQIIDKGVLTVDSIPEYIERRGHLKQIVSNELM